MLHTITNNLDGLIIMYGYLMIAVTLLAVSFGLVKLVDFLRSQVRLIKDANNRVWKQDGNYRL